MLVRGVRLLLFSILAHALQGASTAQAMVCTLPADMNTYAIPAVTKPAHLGSYTDPVFGSTITRITGNPGTAISTGGTWGNIVHHQYSKVQAWNADQSLLFIETNKGGGGSGSVFLDGQTYQPLFSRSCPGNECRWHPTIPNRMVYASGNTVGYWDPAANTTTTVATFPGFTDLTIGLYEGNLSADGNMIVLMESSGSTAFAYNLATLTKHPTLNFSSLGISADNASISPLGNYIVVNTSGDYLYVYDLSGSLVFNTTNYGRPSHFDLAVDSAGNEVAVGVSKSTGDAGQVVKIRLSNGTVTSMTSAGYASHTSTRALQLGAWGVSDYYDNPSWLPYKSEIVTYSLDGSTVYRVAHHRNTSYEYESGAHASPSPDGKRIIFASSWGGGSNRPVQVYVADIRGLCTTPDTTAPTVSMASPSGGSTVSATIAVSANASDNVGVVGVQFKLDGANLGTEVTTAPYTVNWNTTTATNGSHTLTAVARDAAGNSTTAAAVSVTVNNTPPPVNLIANPGFESSMTNWSSWGNSSVRTTNCYAGARCIRAGTGDGGVYQDVTAGLTIGLSYTISGWARLGNISDQNGMIGIEFLNSSGVVIADHPLAVTATSYQKYSKSVTVPVGTTQALVYVWKSSGSSYVFADDFSLLQNP